VNPPLQGGIRQIALVGLMGSGKTTVGTAIGARLGWPVLDSDVQLRSTTGLTAREFRDARGTPALHDAEAQALLRALAQPGPGVICAAASVIENPAARQALTGRDVAVIWLRASPAVLAQRFSSALNRPIYGSNPEAVARAQAEARDPLFASLDPIIVDVDGRSPAAVIEAALGAVRGRFGKLNPPG
jgi:shikimate kinase